MKMLNVGCGYRYHMDWVNLDFIKTGPNVIAHNLNEGIPFEDSTFDVVYHSHLLEHFTKQEGKKLIEECYRVLKNDGIIRIAVPDLEKIVTEYMKNLDGALKGYKNSQSNYEWTMLELYDQTTRNFSGGEMARYLYKEKLVNEEYIYARTGEETRNIRENYLKNKEKVEFKKVKISRMMIIRSSLKRLLKAQTYKTIMHRLLFNLMSDKEKEWLSIGRFRKEGEIHQWMYDRYSLSKLLEEVGFKDVRVKSAFESSISDWKRFELEYKNKIIFKPDSLFIEAIK